MGGGDVTSALPEDKRRALDDYPTPRWAIDAILDYLPIGRDSFVLEPACGAGGVFRSLIDRGVDSSRLHGIEISEERANQARATGAGVLTADALDDETMWPPADLIVSNPPFRQAEAFCRKALTSVNKGGTVAMLLRLAFLESAERYAFHRDYPVTGLWVFSSRPSFTANGKTDSAAYAWFVWSPFPDGIHILPPNEKKRGAK